MKKCIICKIDIKGRTDKKYCSTKCKNYYRSKLREVTKTQTYAINKILHRNREILLEVMGKNGYQKKMKRIELEKRNFKFKYHTHFLINKQGKMYRYVYDFAWMDFSNDEVLIVRKVN